MTRPPTADTSEQNGTALSHIAVVLPAWQPDRRLPDLAEELLKAGFRHLVIIDDGSSPQSHSLFDHLAAKQGVVLCRHDQNRGKGCALKTGFTHIRNKFPSVTGIVTADADGQHTPDDIVRVARQLAATPDHVILGTRTFAAGVPWRSRVGNTFTRALFALLSGRLLRDTQTGLRGLPQALLPTLAQLPGERYEYEMIALAWLCRNRIPLIQLPIETVYLDSNRSSHFDPIRDSLRIYGALLRFYGGPLRRGRSKIRVDRPHLRAA